MLWWDPAYRIPFRIHQDMNGNQYSWTCNYMGSSCQKSYPISPGKYESIWRATESLKFPYLVKHKPRCIYQFARSLFGCSSLIWTWWKAHHLILGDYYTEIALKISDADGTKHIMPISEITFTEMTTKNEARHNFLLFWTFKTAVSVIVVLFRVV